MVVKYLYVCSFHGLDYAVFLHGTFKEPTV